MSDPARFVRQILLPEIGERGQARIGAATAAVGGPSLAHEVASRYAAGAGFAGVAPGEIDVDALAPLQIATIAPAREVLAGARAALAALNDVIREETS